MKLVYNSLAAWAAVAASMLVGIVVTPTLVAELGIEANGLWRLVVQIVGYYGLVDLALGAAVIRYLAKYRGEKRLDEFRETFQSAVAIAAAFALGLVVLIALTGGVIADWLFDGDEAETFGVLIRLLAIATGLNAVNAVLGSVLVAHEQIVLNSAVRFCSEIIRMVVSVVILRSGGGLIGLGWLFVALAIAHIGVNLVLTRRLHGELVKPLRGYSKIAGGKLGRFGAAAAASKVGDILRFQVDLVVLTSVVSLEAAGVYGVVIVLVRGFINAVLAVADSTQPRLAAIAVNRYRFRRSLLTYTNIVCLLIAFLAACAFWLIEPVLHVWLPDNLSTNNIDDAALVFRVLIIGMAVDMMMVVPTVGLRAINKHKYYAWQNIAEGVANLVLSLILGHRYGMVGVAFGTTIPSIVSKVFIQPIYSAHFFGVRTRSILGVAIRPMLVFAAVAVFTGYVTPPIPSTYGGLLALAVPTAAVVGMITLVVGSSRGTRLALDGLRPGGRAEPAAPDVQRVGRHA